MPTDEERLHEFFREQKIRERDARLAQTIRDRQLGGNIRESTRQFNESTRNRAFLLAASKRLRHIYFWGSTILLFVVSSLFLFAPRLLVGHFGPSNWYLLLMLLGAIVLPLCALRGYFVWMRSNWYRWIGKTRRWRARFEGVG
jgi:hypothetical protein